MYLKLLLLSTTTFRSTRRSIYYIMNHDVRYYSNNIINIMIKKNIYQVILHSCVDGLTTLCAYTNLFYAIKKRIIWYMNFKIIVEFN